MEEHALSPVQGLAICLTAGAHLNLASLNGTSSDIKFPNSILAEVYQLLAASSSSSANSFSSFVPFKMGRIVFRISTSRQSRGC